MFDRFTVYPNSINFLSQSLKKDRLAQSYLFYGQDLEEIFAIAKEFAKLLLCQKAKKDNCDCQSCLAFSSDITGSHPDLMGLDFEWGEDLQQGEGVKGIREILHKLSLSPIWGKRKVAILRYVDCFNKESANTLLKTLEEPSASSYIILIAQSLNNVLPTITSRTMNLEFKKKETKRFGDLESKKVEWRKALKGGIKDKFDLAEELADKGLSLGFLDWLDNYLRDKNRQQLVVNQLANDNKQLVIKRVALQKKIINAKQVISSTNANKCLALQSLFLDIDKSLI